MIRARALRKAYGDFQVLKNLDFELQSGAITGLAGPNASGKSTLVKCLLSLVLLDSGELWLEEQRLGGDADYREKIGFMPQDAEFPLNIAPFEYFKLLQSLRAKNSRNLPELLAAFELEPYLRKPFSKLSAGTRQKIAAVGALMFEAPLLILDEPTAGLDPVACNTFKRLLKNANANGATVLIVSHIMSELEQLVENLFFLLEGELLFCGALDELRNKTEEINLEEGIIKLISQRFSCAVGARA